MNTYPKSYSPVPGGSAKHVATGALPTRACVCGGAGCSQCQTQSFVRPQFFAGQLLTEEDLQVLGNYVVSKNRLHNRHFFGEGVVCGLEVTCHPCGGGTVIVHPGYALDCCGNDIVLSCPQTLDINAMVRELRIKLLGGYDCGDPCKDKPKDPCGDDKVSTGTPAKGNDMGHSDTAREYCLYIRYCEEPTDPVTPYSTDEPCGAQLCQPTRVREGVRFELRCREEDKWPDDLLTRICCCLGDLDSAQKSMGDGQWHQGYSRQIITARDSIKANPTPPFAEADIGDYVASLREWTTTLQTETQNLAKKGQQLPKPEAAEIALRPVLDAALEVASLVARFYVQEAETNRTLLAVENTGLSESLRVASQIFESTEGIVTPQLIDALPTPLDREEAMALFEVGNEVMVFKTGETFDIGTHAIRKEGAQAAIRTEHQFLAYKAVFTSRLLAESAKSLDALREWLLDRLDKSPFLTDCRLRQEVMSVVLPAQTVQQNIMLSDATALVTAALSLISALWRYLRDCLCAALNPACPPCEDTAVLLACLKVKDCEVISICNLERTFVLSPVAFRYWLPPLRFLGEIVEKLCCAELKLPAKNFSIRGLFYWLRLLCRKDARLPGNLMGTIYAMFQGQASERGLASLQEAMFGAPGGKSLRGGVLGEISEPGRAAEAPTSEILTDRPTAKPGNGGKEAKRAKPKKG